MAVAPDRAGLSPAFGSGMGICLPGRHHIAVLVGQLDFDRAGQLQRQHSWRRSEGRIPGRVPSRSICSPQIRGGSITFTATLRNGALITGTATIRAVRRQMDLPGRVGMTGLASCAAELVRRSGEPPAPPATGADPTTATTTRASGLPEGFYPLLDNLFTSCEARRCRRHGRKVTRRRRVETFRGKPWSPSTVAW